MLTDRQLKTIKPTGKVFKRADGRGLSIRVGKQGTITFQYRYKIAGKEDCIDIGNYPETSLAEARDKHHEFRLLVKKGTSPADQKRQTRTVAASAENPTVAEFAENEFIPRCLDELESADEATRCVRANLLSQIGDMRMKAVKLRHVTLSLDKIVDRGSKTMANRTLSYAKQMFSFAVRRGVLEYNPLSELRKKEVGGLERPRQRALSNDELRALLPNIPRLGAPYAQWVSLVLLLGPRQGEVRLTKKTDLKLDGNAPTWTIPIANQKSRNRVKWPHDHVIPLSPQAVVVWQELIDMSGKSEFVMPSPILKHDAPLSEKVLNDQLRDIRDQVDGEPGPLLGVAKHWTPHDLRRTLKTRMSEDLKVLPHVSERILNHAADEMEATYNLAMYQDEMRAALCAWADRLDMLSGGGGGNVVPIRRAAL